MRPHVIAFFERFMPHDIASLFAPGWFTCVGLAGIVGLFVMMRIGRKHGIDSGITASIVLWCYLAAVSAGIIIPMLIEGTEHYVAHGRFVFRWAGMTSFWGYLAGIGAVTAVCRHHKIPLAKFGDLATVPMGVALFFSRLGCFLGGCDYGKVTSVPWAMRFPQGSPAWVDHVNSGLVPAGRMESLPVHPTQLYESALGLVIIGVSIAVARTAWAKQRQGRLFLSACATYAIGRILIETVRADLGRGIYLGMSSGQIFSVCVLLVCASGFLITRRRLIATLATAGIVCALVVDSHDAAAQPAPPPAEPQPQPQPPVVQGGVTVQGGVQVGPNGVQVQGGVQVNGSLQVPSYPPQPQPYVQPVPYTMVPQALFGASNSIGLLLGIATPLNRREDQVKALTGVTLSLGFAIGGIGTIGVDYDSYGNADASHGTLLATGGIVNNPNARLRYGARAGLGVTLVNFHDPVFRDVTGTTMRAEAIGEYDLTPRWMLWARPLSFDYLTAADLGGPIITWQIRVGIAYKWGHTTTVAVQPQYPPNAYPPSPYPQYPPPAAPYPQPPPNGGYPTYPGAPPAAPPVPQ